MTRHSTRLCLWLGVSAAALAAATVPGIGSATAQEATAAPVPVEEVVVTGTSIRGVAPVGSNLISVNQDAIQTSGAANIEQLLNQVPGLSNTGAAPQGPNNSSFYSPAIHQLAGSASNTTLVLFDGYRIPQGNTQHSETDPNIMPTIALQRVEVLADGASSVYGSDAVAGVINFITRRHFTGVEVQLQAGEGSNYSTNNANLLAGKDWDSGSVLLAYSHVYYSNLPNASRAFLQTNHIAQGGTNFNSFNCSPATIQPNSTGNIYLSPTATTSVANTAANAPCTTSNYGDALPQEKRDNVLVKGSQKLGRFTLNAEVLYAVRQTFSQSAPGTLSAVAFGTGAQSNPFYVNPPGVTATSQKIGFSTVGLVPNGYAPGGSNTFYATAGADYNVDDNWVISFANVLGKDTTFADSFGGFCASCAELALNGTTNSTGNTTSPAIPATTINTLNLPLTAANALDVWNAPGANRTSAAVLASLTSATSTNINYNSFDQMRLNADGQLFELPAGPFRVAVGGEIVHYSLIQDVVSANNTGPSTTGSTYYRYRFGRIVQSAYAELAIPLISPAMNIPLIQQIDIDIAGRYDHYSDVGSTKNPKYAANWTVIDGLKLVANYSTSFVAPALDSVGDPSQFYNYATSTVNSNTTPTNFNTAYYPGTAGVLPGCAATATTCTVGTSATPGITFAKGGGPNLKPQTGYSWSIGADIAPDFLPGFSATVSYFNNKLKGGVTSPNQAAEVNTASLRSLFTICPAGCSAAQVAAATANVFPVKGALPTTAYFLYNFNQRNVLNLTISGIDLVAQYHYDTGTIGEFRIGDSLTEFTRFDQSFGNGASFSVLNTSGINQTFPSIQTQMRANLGWSMGPYAVDMFVNYTGAYRNWGTSSVVPIVPDANGNASSGGDKVNSNTTVDLHVAYNFETELLGGDQVYVEVQNMFDKDPPFYNSAAGYNTYNGNPVGRVVSLGIRANF